MFIEVIAKTSNEAEAYTRLINLDKVRFIRQHGDVGIIVFDEPRSDALITTETYLRLMKRLYDHVIR
jgi:hypothetical protein